MNEAQPIPFKPEVARPAGRRLCPFPDMHVSVPIHMPITTAQMENVRLGWIPEDMSDRWFIYVDEGNVAHIHRGGTGYCVYRVNFAPHQDGWAAVQLDANRDSEQYSNVDIERDVQTVKTLIQDYLMRNRSPSVPNFIPGIGRQN